MHTEPRAARFFLLARLSPRPGERCRYPDEFAIKPRITIRLLLAFVAVSFIGFVVGNQYADHQLSKIKETLAFEPVGSDVYFLTDATPRILDSKIKVERSLVDYLLFRRRAHVEFRVELDYHGEYGGGVNQKMPGEPDMRFKCIADYRASPFTFERISNHSYQMGIPDGGWKD